MPVASSGAGKRPSYGCRLAAAPGSSTAPAEKRRAHGAVDLTPSPIVIVGSDRTLTSRARRTWPEDDAENLLVNASFEQCSRSDPVHWGRGKHGAGKEATFETSTNAKTAGPLQSPRRQGRHLGERPRAGLPRRHRDPRRARASVSRRSGISSSWSSSTAPAGAGRARSPPIRSPAPTGGTRIASTRLCHRAPSSSASTCARRITSARSGSMTAAARYRTPREREAADQERYLWPGQLTRARRRRRASDRQSHALSHPEVRLGTDDTPTP